MMQPHDVPSAPVAVLCPSHMMALKPAPSARGAQHSGQPLPWFGPDAHSVCLDLWSDRALLSEIQFVISQNPQILSMGLLCSFLSPSLYRYPKLPRTRCRNWHLLLLIFMWLVVSQSANLSMSLFKAPFVSADTKVQFSSSV